MAAENEFVTYLLELLGPFGSVEAKSMFGGFGVYRDNLMFGLVSQDTLYLKVDDENRPDFEARDLGPFTYERKGKTLALSYYQAPHEAIEDGAVLCQWAQKAFDAARRGAVTKRKQGKK